MEDVGRVVECSLVCSVAVNERTLLILAAVGASVVAYAVYALMTRGAVAEQPAPASVASNVHEDVESPRAPAAKKRSATPAPPRPPLVRPPAKPQGGPPPALPKPEVSLEEAREDYDALMKELERELQRNKDTGKALANEHWVDYYTRTHEVMDPLRYYLSFGTEAEKKDVGALDEELRVIMADLQRDPSTLDAENERPTQNQ
jgi:type IV secretory pathway VirB10-like protein